MSGPLPLVLVQQPACRAGDLTGFAADLRRQIPSSGAEPLVIYPELHLCGGPDADAEAVQAAMTDTAEPLAGPRDRALAELAGDLGIWLAPGTVYERGQNGCIYNTAVVYSPAGQRVASYRKIFPWRPYETSAAGAEFVVFDIGGVGRIGLSICYDAWFPESTRHLAWMGADLVLNLVRTATADREQELILARANAITNQVFVASVNAAAPAGVGRSLLVDPEGRVRDETVDAEPATLTSALDLDEVRRVRRDGTAGLNRMWDQFGTADDPLELPLYAGKIDPANWKPSGHAVSVPHNSIGERRQ